MSRDILSGVVGGLTGGGIIALARFIQHQRDRLQRHRENQVIEDWVATLSASADEGALAVAVPARHFVIAARAVREGRLIWYERGMVALPGTRSAAA
jgi:hypothetical protein